MTSEPLQALAPGRYPSPGRRLLVTVPAMMACTMVAVDITIANVALPHMSASLSASQEQILWVLTSYLVAAAIATPLSGWLAGRVGRKNVMLVSVAGFTMASAVCGLSTSLGMIVTARLVQGACGAALVPLSQAILLDINPPEDHPKAMVLFSAGTMTGPIIGPTLGGWLTDTLSWRWVFFINVPFGIFAFVGMSIFMMRRLNREVFAFDFFGFATVSISVGSLQLILDRGANLDWFDSNEIRLYAVILAISLWLSMVHIFTAKNPFIRPEIFRDRNFAIGTVCSAMIGFVTFASLPIITVMTQSLLGYTAYETGIVGLPRGLGTLVAMVIVARVSRYLDLRVLMTVGLLITGFSMLMYARMDLYVDEHFLILTGLVQGFGGGLTFVPLSVAVFSTLNPELRNEGTAMYSLMRNMGNAVGISVLQVVLIDYTAQSRARLTEMVRPDNPTLQYARPDLDFGSLPDLAGINAEIMRQAGMVGDVRLFLLIGILTIALIPLVIAMRVKRRGNDEIHFPIGE